MTNPVQILQPHIENTSFSRLEWSNTLVVDGPPPAQGQAIPVSMKRAPSILFGAGGGGLLPSSGRGGAAQVPTHLFTYLPTYIRTCVPSYLPTYLLTDLPTYLPTYLQTYPFTYLPTYLPTYPPTYPPTYLPSYLPTYLHTYIPPPAQGAEERGKVLRGAEPVK